MRFLSASLKLVSAQGASIRRAAFGAAVTYLLVLDVVLAPRP